MLDADGHAFFLGVADNLFQTHHAVLSALLGRDFAALRVFGLLPFVTVKRDYVFHAKLGAGINRLLGGLDHHVMVIGVVKPAHEGRAFHAVRCDGAGEAVFLEHGPVIGGNQLYALAAEIGRRLGGILNLPAALAPAPVHHGLVDAAFLHTAFGFGGLGGDGGREGGATGQFHQITT